MESQCLTRSAFTSLTLFTASYDPSTSKYLPLLVEFFESVRTIRKVGTFVRPVRCSRIFNIDWHTNKHTAMRQRPSYREESPLTWLYLVISWKCKPISPNTAMSKDFLPYT